MEVSHLAVASVPSMPTSDDCVQPTPPSPTLWVNDWMVAAAPAEDSICLIGMTYVILLLPSMPWTEDPAGSQQVASEARSRRSKAQQLLKLNFNFESRNS